MGLARKTRKICPKLGHPESRDRISSLPDEILGQILSFLPTKYAVATSALSSRWRNLYKLTTSLDFDDSASFKSQKGLNIVRRNTRFREFVDSILARFEQSNVTKFRLKCGKNNFDNSLISYWIKVACSHEISEFELSIHTCVPYRLPLQRYPLTCQNLAVLKLDSNFEVDIPDSVAFPCLKVLVLKEIKLSSDSSLNDILPRCPLLEELVIEGCDIAEGNVCITNPLLRRLTLDDGLTGPLDQLNGTVVYFDAPNLIYLKYCKCLVHRCKVRDLNALVEAYIEICFNDDDFDEPEDLCDAMLSFIVGVSNCELLYLSGQCLEALTSGEFELPIFQNLTRLELGVGCDVSWNDVLLDFLSNSPCLEYLIFEEGLIRFGAIDYESEDCQLYDEAVPSCVESRLKVIEIKRFWGLKEEMDTVMYFLENANVLEKLELHWCLKRSARGVLSKEKEILKMYKVNDACSIAFR